MRFSIIIPAHNAEYFIGQAIDSILNQGFSDYEIIVVFDRCEDGTERVVQSYWADHPKQISWQYTNAGGVSEARNIGLARASGEYILFLDADDSYVSSALEKLDRVASKENNPDILFSGYNRVTENQKVLKPFAYQFCHAEGVPLVVDYLNKVSYTHLGALCFSHGFLNHNGIKFDTSLRYAEDIVFCATAFFLAKRVCSTDTTIHNWTKRKQSTLYTMTLDRFNSLDAIASLKGFFVGAGIHSKPLNTAIANHYAMMLLDTVSTLIWLGCDIETLDSEVQKRVDFSMLFPYFHIQTRLRRNILELRFLRRYFLRRVSKKPIPHNFVLSSKDSSIHNKNIQENGGRKT